MYKVGIITASDKGAKGLRQDLSGPAIKDILRKFDNFHVTQYELIPDDLEIIKNAICKMADEQDIDLILTTGGTGFSRRDVTPEATLAAIDRRVPGIPEAMRYLSLQITPRAMLSRAEAGFRGKALIVNMPGSPKAIAETLEYILSSVEHGLDTLSGISQDCATLK
ncbi:MAG: molybdopterin adenylyltransferase [Anaerovorax sp.]